MDLHDLKHRIHVSEPRGAAAAKLGIGIAAIAVSAVAIAAIVAARRRRAPIVITAEA